MPGLREFTDLVMTIEAMNLILPIAATFPLKMRRMPIEDWNGGDVLGKIVLDIASGHGMKARVPAA